MRKGRTILLSLLVVGVAIAGFWLKFLYTPIVNDVKGFQYRVQAGASIKSVINDLREKDIIKHPIFFNTLVRLRGDSQELKAGEYLFPNGTTPSSMLNQLMTGSGMVYHAFTIVPGWSFKELSDALLKENTVRHTLPRLSHQEIMARLGHPELNPEGQFFPDTYFFAEGSADFVILKRAFKSMQEKLTAAWNTREPGLPFKNPNEVLIAASLVEKEAYLKQERTVIAAVLINRLRHGMLLQFDPTVIYGMGYRYVGNITKENLLEDTPYNTYLHKGLPPTPIAMPSLDSITATVHPDHNEYFYFVARGDGSHQFSKTLVEHYAAVSEVKKQNPWFFNDELMRNHFKTSVRALE